MSYLYGKRLTTPVTPLITSLRSELYSDPYESIPWSSCKNEVASVDIYNPHTKILDWINSVLSLYEKIPGKEWITNKACDEALKQIRFEDESTSFLCLAPVSDIGLNRGLFFP